MEMSRIFINYRREDTQQAVGRLTEELGKHFDSKQIFADITSIVPGADFVEALKQGLDTVAAMLVVIGPRWLMASDRQGRRRLDLPGDWVRQEIAEGLRRSGVRVFPVLVDGAEMPSEEELPEALRALVRRQAFPLTVRHWRNDVEQLSEFLRTVPGLASTPAHRPRPGVPSPTRVPWKPLAAIGGVLALALLFSQAVPQHEKKPKAEEARPAPATEAPKPSCSIAGTVFHKVTKRPLPGLIIGFIQYTEHKNAKEVAFNVATTGLNGAFKATCKGIAESDFPLRIVVRELNPQVSYWTPVKVELGDELTEVNLPMSLYEELKQK